MFSHIAHVNKKILTNIQNRFFGKYKLKTKSACKKRFRVTESGEVYRTQAGSKRSRRGKGKRKHKTWVRVTHKGTLKQLKRFLPYWKIKTKVKDTKIKFSSNFLFLLQINNI